MGKTSDQLSAVFLKNDIRGVYGEILDKEFGYYFGVSLGQFMESESMSSLVIGSDNRESSPELIQAVTSGLASEGIEVTHIGIVPTPAVYFITATEKFDVGVIVTASHNPKEYNGIKVCDRTGASYSYNDFFKGIMTRMSSLNCEMKFVDLPEIDRSYVDKYVKFLRSKLSNELTLSIAAEYGNGTTSLFSQVIENETRKEIGETMDPSFSRLLPDPAKDSSYVFLKGLFKSGNYEMGIIFDTDGDRVGFTDEKGEIISPDQISMLFLDFLEDHNKLLIDVKMSKAIRDYAIEKGYTVDFTEVGHSKVHENLLHKKFDIAAELSCHYYFNLGYYGFDDGLYAAVQFINIVKKIKSDGRTLSEIVSQLPKYYSSKEHRVRCRRETQDKIIKTLHQIAMKRGAEIVDIDGIRCHFNDGWLLVRPSSTEERLSYRVEGVTEESREKYLDLINHVISQEMSE